MSDTVDKEISELFVRMARFIKRHGKSRIITKLQRLDYEKTINTSIINFILERVCIRYNIKIKDLLGRKRRSYAEARKLCYLLMYNTAKDSENSELAIANYFDRSKTVVYQARKEFHQMCQNPKLKEEIAFIKLYNEIDAEVKEFEKKSNKNLNNGKEGKRKAKKK